MKRRQFLTLTGTLTGGYLLVPQFLHALGGRTGLSRSNGIVVFLQLDGGNDGLNTLIPFSDSLYYTFRPNISISREQVIRINRDLGWHPRLEGIASIQQAGHLTVIQNVGYPNPNRSHFRSQEIWETASDSNIYMDKGWLGRYLDIQCEDIEPVAGVTINSADNLALTGSRPNSITVNNPNQFKPLFNGKANTTASDNPQLDFVRRIAFSTKQGADLIRDAMNKSSDTGYYPSTKLGRNLQWIARLIKGDLSTRVFYTSQKGYDTHHNQLNEHAKQLKQLDQAIYAFYRDLKSSDLLNDVTLVIFSEFGRRVKDNGGGTDHGKAAPMMIIGGKTKGNIIGTNPDLFHLDKGDLIHKIDFRSVYASILNDKLAFDPSKINIKQKALSGLF
ncbi:DUF1501 domain-containing protein [Aureitalea marina]|uniref:Twin-arginine translocation pathway signal sequence domain protein n=1 Tax=Aureitalea marina TaxID=930804 RepID=A0A2S7KPC2_9FLAO|nr:DUF1501 domain-containing protein [Aureitalea marina]PQB04413.1 Twin-arginine translocation pathway signal sequence domain protein precursor [Aureitalea marina]